MNRLIIAAFLSVIFFNVSAQDKKQEVEKTLEMLRQAILDGDSAKLNALTDADLSYGHSLGKIENKQQFVGALASGTSDFERMDITDQSIVVKGKTAMVRHTVSAKVTDAGKMSEVKLAVLLVFVKEDKQWKLLARQAIRLAQ